MSLTKAAACGKHSGHYTGSVCSAIKGGEGSVAPYDLTKETGLELDGNVMNFKPLSDVVGSVLPILPSGPCECERVGSARRKRERPAGLAWRRRARW